MKKLLLITSALDVGGAQRFFLNVGRYFNSMDREYEVLFLRQGKSKAIRDEYINNKINFVELGCKSVFRALPRLIKHINHYNPDVILCTIDNVDFVVSISKLFFPKIKLIVRKANVVFDTKKTIINKMILKFESKMSNKLVALTQEMKEDYLQYGFKNDQITVINNMVDLEYIRKRYSEYDGVEHPWFQQHKYFTLIASARFVQEKRFDILISAFIQLRENRSNVRLMILGDGPLLDQLKKMVPQNLENDVEFLGFQANPYYFLKNADIFILTSDYEGFPNVLIEAMACGLPVVSTNCKSGPKEIIRQGIEGYIVPKQDVGALCEKINDILVNEKNRKRMAKQAEIRANNYDIDKIGKEYLKLIDEL